MEVIDIQIFRKRIDEYPLVVVTSGTFKGIVGLPMERELSMLYYMDSTVKINNGNGNTFTVCPNQVKTIPFNISTYDFLGVCILNKDGSFRNVYEILNELKERKIMISDDYRGCFNEFMSTRTISKPKTKPKKVEVNITDVNIIVQNKVVEVTFADGAKEKSVCREPDVFSLELAIAICISKKIMGGSSAYNNAVRRGVKIYKDKLKKIKADKAEQERIAKKREKRIAYKKRRAVKKEQAEKEKQIEIQKEAYIRAIKALEDSKNPVVQKENN